MYMLETVETILYLYIPYLRRKNSAEKKRIPETKGNLHWEKANPGIPKAYVQTKALIAWKLLNTWWEAGMTINLYSDSKRKSAHKSPSFYTEPWFVSFCWVAKGDRRQQGTGK